jgi:hypothetical protein
MLIRYGTVLTSSEKVISMVHSQRLVNRLVRLGFFGCALACAPLCSASDLCSEIQSSLVPQSKFTVPTTKLARLEIRRCDLEYADLLQLVGWAGGASRPALIVDTNRSTVAELVMRGNVVVIVTAGATTEVLQVIRFSKGVPKLALERHLKEIPKVTISSDTVNIRFTYEGLSETHLFPINE